MKNLVERPITFIDDPRDEFKFIILYHIIVYSIILIALGGIVGLIVKIYD